MREIKITAYNPAAAANSLRPRVSSSIRAHSPQAWSTIMGSVYARRFADDGLSRTPAQWDELARGVNASGFVFVEDQ